MNLTVFWYALLFAVNMSVVQHHIMKTKSISILTLALFVCAVLNIWDGAMAMTG